IGVAASRRGRQLQARRENNLVDPETILTHLDPHAMCAGGREINQRSEYASAIPVVLPPPAGDAAPAARLEHVGGGVGCSDPEGWCTGATDAGVELYKCRVVRVRIRLRLPANPESVGDAGQSIERQLEVRGRRCRRGK